MFLRPSSVLNAPSRVAQRHRELAALSRLSVEDVRDVGTLFDQETVVMAIRPRPVGLCVEAVVAAPCDPVRMDDVVDVPRPSWILFGLDRIHGDHSTAVCRHQ